jgi:hypothetical protein
MRMPMAAIAAGAGLGLLDGLSAWFYPEARSMMMAIVAGSTIKGVITGLIVGLVAQRWRSLPIAVASGAVVGFILSAMAAQGQPNHYWSIVLPGMLVGVIVGVIAQRKAVAAAAVVLLIAAAQAASAQAPSTQSLAILDGLIGRWQGTSEGQPGQGTVEREYTRILRSRFVQAQNRSVYPPQEKNPKGEEHLDTAVFSFDRQRQQIVMRQFHVEGFVSQYVLQSATASTFVFVSEAIENIPAGFRARETYQFTGPDGLVETFEMAEPGKDFAVYSRTTLRKVP